MRRVLIILGLLAPLIFLQANGASAIQPTVTTFHDEGTGLPVQDCGSFTVLLDFSHDEIITTYYDNSGKAIREQIRFSFTATLRNSVTGKTAYEKGAFTLTVDLLSGNTRTVGLVLLIRVPGNGVVVLELGQVTFDDAGGPSLIKSPKILDGESLICSILA